MNTNTINCKKMMIGFICTFAIFVAFVLAFPSVARAADGETKVHVLTIGQSANSILVESNGSFGMIDSGEDNECPDLQRPGITCGQGTEEYVINYLKSVGVNENNFEFYIGTHPHSDHIGSADEIIKEFKPKQVYLKRYSDALLNTPAGLWDNQHVYDNAVAAANEVGAELIQELDEGQVVPFGNSTLTFYNARNNDVPGSISDANELSLGVKLTDNTSGKSAFIAGDIDNYKGLETKLADSVGKVDVMVLGHHGYRGSNSYKYLMSLNPSIFVIPYSHAEVSRVSDPGDSRYNPFDTVVSLLKKGARIFAEGDYKGLVGAIVVTLDDQLTNNVSNLDKWTRLRGPDPDRGSLYVTLHDGAYVDDTNVCTGGSWRRFGDRWSYQKADGSWLAGDFYKIDGHTYHFTSDGYLSVGWVYSQGHWYYFANSGEMVTGWIKYSGAWYYLGSSGTMATGWIRDGSAWYYLDGSGVMKTGWLKSGGKWYYLASSGAMATGWIKDGGVWYYLDSTGMMATGWIKDGGTSYYLDGSGAMRTGWLKSGGNWYYMSSSGAMSRGWIKDGGVWYYLDGSGVMKTGMLNDGSAWYYLDGSGAMRTGWVYSSGAWYYFGDSGAMRTGWLKAGGKWYYLDSSGAMVTGTHTIEGRTYSFNSEGSLR